MFGYERDEALGLPINDLIVPETLLDSTREHTGRLQHGQRVEGETVRRSKNGIDVHVFLLAVPITTASGEHVANYAIYRDITERKRAEERLVESEARFRTMAEKAPRYTGAGSLAAWQQRVVAAYIEEHLAEAIPLNILARLVHLSPYYFCRAFKQSFGIPPHRYHIKRRIDCAKTLLRFHP